MSTDATLNLENCWQALVDKNRIEDGNFYYGVVTTGVYCRPSCAARTPKRENVRFYVTVDEAERDGLRPCLRCHPRAIGGTDPMTETVRKLCTYIEDHADSPLTLRDLSAVAGVSPYHLQRSFKAVAGVSPKEYLDGCRTRKFKGILRRDTEEAVTGAIYEAGYGSLSRMYENSDARLGMTPMEYRNNGRGVAITYATAETVLGPMMIGATDRGICFLQFGETDQDLVKALRAEYPEADIRAMTGARPPEFEEWVALIRKHLEGAQPNLRLPLHVRATAFQLRVWRYLQTIPAGKVESYREVAAGIGAPAAVRAVAKACATNKVALAIPCHRVIRATGELGGYRWGIERKRVLLDSERRNSRRS